MPNKTSTGFDRISKSLIKQVILSISRPLTAINIMNYSISTGVVLEDMKIARVTPIFLNGDPTMANNYRPISVLTSFSKIIERIIYDRTLQFLDKYNIVSDNQYGFWSNHSTIHAIIKLILWKAFDTVNHDILWTKLDYYAYQRSSIGLVKK